MVATERVVSNILYSFPDADLYDLDPFDVIRFSCQLSKIDAFASVEPVCYTGSTFTYRGPQSAGLLQSFKSLPPVSRHLGWLEGRGVQSVTGIYDDDFELSLQEALDLHIIPADHIIERHGFRPVSGPVFLDTRGGRVAGICVRNVANDKLFAADAKFTFSNFGFFLWGYDDYNSEDEVTICEGVFDAIALRSAGYKAIAIGGATPTVFQLACLKWKFGKFLHCFDDDLYGWCGALAAATCLGGTVLMCSGKDPAESLSGGELLFETIGPGNMITDLGQLAELIGFQAKLRRKINPDRLDLVRDLPYN